MTNLSAIAIGPRQVRLCWNATEDVGSGLIAYKIQKRKKYSMSEWEIIESLKVSDNWVDIKNLKPYQEYEFRVIPESTTSLGVPSDICSTMTLTDGKFI